MQNESMEHSYHEYLHGNLDKKQLEGVIFQFVLKNCQRFHLHNWEEGECIDYLCWLYPRIGRAIDKYAFSGSSFDAYINSLIRWSSKEYRIRETEHRIIERACWNARSADSADMEAHSGEPEYPETAPAINTVPNPQQILVLVLKSYYYVSEDFLDRIAPAIGIQKEKLAHLIEEVRKRRIERDDAIADFRSRVHSQFYRCLAYEKRLHAAAEGSAREDLLRNCLEKSWKRLETMRKRLKAIRIEASNRQIAEVLGVSKGTVDSNLHAVKSKKIHGDLGVETYTFGKN